VSCFKNKVVVITGAGSGIGRALAQQCAARGAQLALSDINADALAETLTTLPAGTKAKSYVVDIAKRESMFAHAADVQRDFGTAHYVINNAGVLMTGTFDHMSLEEIEWQLNINLWGVIYGNKAFLPMLLAQREGCIVNISSTLGLVGLPIQSAYNIAKFGVRGLTEALWSELDGTGVRAVCVFPGGIRTNLDKGGRMCAKSGAEEARYAGLAEKIQTTTPTDCANQILDGIERGDLRILPGNKASTLDWLARFLPSSYPKVLKMMSR
jgi:short-subunit dehydrogenase